MATAIFDVAEAEDFVFRHDDRREWMPGECRMVEAAFDELGATARRFNNRLEADLTVEPAINKESQAEIRRLYDAVAGLSTRVAVLEAKHDSIDNRVRRVMTEVIANWERQHTAR